MTEYDFKVNGELLSNLLSGHDGVSKLLESILNQVLNAQACEQPGADRYERTDDRMAYRNGYRPRQLFTRVGPVTLQVPQFRDGQFSTEIFKRFQRSCQALVLSLMEMVVNGVSTRKVTRITDKLCGVSFSKSTVSQLCSALDARVKAFNERPLGQFPFLLVDAMYLKARPGNAVESRAALVISGVNTDGQREIPGVRIGDSEAEAFWRETFDWLKGRRLSGVRYLVSDDHAGLAQAARRCFQGAIWQRCQVHFMRNALSYTGSKHKLEMGNGLKRILASDTAEEARIRFDQLAQSMEGAAQRAIECLENGLEDALAVMALPGKYRRRMKSTNMQERLIREIRRRERVTGIFPNEDSAHRLIGAFLAEIHEEWQDKRYFDMNEFNEWLAEREKEISNMIVAIN